MSVHSSPKFARIKAPFFRVISPAAVASALLFPPVTAGATQKVYSPIVEQGEVAIEYRMHHDIDKRDERDGAQKMKMEIEFGVTDRWATAIEGEMERENDGDAMHYSATAWENIVQFTPQGKYWADPGIFIELEKPSGTSEPEGKLETRFLLQKSLPESVHTANVVFEKQLGARSNGITEYGYAWSSKFRVTQLVDAGFEVHGTFGDISHTPAWELQTHQAGPVIYGAVPLGDKGDKFKYELGYLVGLTRATADGSLKFLVEYESHF